MPGRQGRGGTKSAPRGLRKKNAKKKKPVKKTGKSGKPALKASYGRQDHRHAPEEKATDRKKLIRETTGVDEDLDYGAGVRGHRGGVTPRRPPAGKRRR